MNARPPGWVNAHTHASSGLAAWLGASEGGLPHGLPAAGDPSAGYLERLERSWWRYLRALDLEALRAAARLYVAEALLEGTTAIVDHHESPGCVEGSLDVLADACQELGMRAVIGYAASERHGGREEARRGLAECRRFLKSNARPLVRGVVGLHASHTLSDETVREAGELALRMNTVVHVQVAEDEHDVQDALRRGYSSPFSRLAAYGALPPRSIVAHGVRLSREAVRAADERELWIVQCPRANALSGAGHPQELGASTRVVLGTDGLPSDPLAEAEALFFAARPPEDGLEPVAARVRDGERLVAERFGPGSRHRAEVDYGRIVVGERVVAEDGELLGARLQDLVEEAARQAERVRARMDAL